MINIAVGVGEERQSAQTVTVQLQVLTDDAASASQPCGSRPNAAQPRGSASGTGQPSDRSAGAFQLADDVEVVDKNACTTNTYTADDYAHRGPQLQTMPLYLYRLYGADPLRIRERL